MNLIITKALRVPVPLLTTIDKYFKLFRSERNAALDPEGVRAVDEEIFEAAIRRMAAGQLDDSLLKKFVSKVTGLIATPASYKALNMTAWLVAPEVKENLRKAVSAKRLGVEPPADTVNRLEATLIKISFFDLCEGKRVVEVVIAVLAASIQSHVRDPGTAALMTASYIGIASDLTEIKRHLQASSGVGLRTLDRCWDDWAKVTILHLNGLLFDSAILTSK